MIIIVLMPRGKIAAHTKKENRKVTQNENSYRQQEDAAEQTWTPIHKNRDTGKELSKAESKNSGSARKTKVSNESKQHTTAMRGVKLQKSNSAEQRNARAATKKNSTKPSRTTQKNRKKVTTYASKTNPTGRKKTATSAKRRR